MQGWLMADTVPGAQLSVPPWPRIEKTCVALMVITLKCVIQIHLRKHVWVCKVQ